MSTPKFSPKRAIVDQTGNPIADFRDGSPLPHQGDLILFAGQYRTVLHVVHEPGINDGTTGGAFTVFVGPEVAPPKVVAEYMKTRSA